MPGIFRATFEYKNLRGRGWSETYFSNLTTYAGVLTRAKVLGRCRRNLLGSDIVWQMVRISDDSIKRDASVYFPPAGDEFNTYGSIFGVSDPAPVGLVVRLEATEAYRRTAWLRGIPDSMTTLGGLFTPLPLWDTAYGLWQDELKIGTWGQKVQTVPAVPKILQNCIQDATSGALTMSCTTPHGFNIGDYVNIRGIVGGAGVNGRHRVIAPTLTGTFTIPCSRIFSENDITGQVYPMVFSVVPFTTVEWVRIATRKTGSPFDRPHGRR